MARKIKAPDALPSKAWLMSFGDTMTTLLAFFIVLCSMAEDQTGINLHSGTGSFIETLKKGGLPGAFPGTKTDRAIQFQATSPLYRPASDSEDVSREGLGPDEPNDVRSKDREQEEFMRLLNEIERFADVETGRNTVGETTFDFFKKLSREAPYLPANYNELNAHILPLLRKQTHRIELVVWAATPSRTARARASHQAQEIVSELLRRARVAPENSSRILGVARNWPYRDVKRPVLSIVIRRVDA